VLNRPNLSKSEIKQALDNKDDPNLAIIEDIFGDSVHNKLDKLRKEQSEEGRHSLYEGPYNSLDEVPESLRPFASNLNARVQNKSMALKLLNWFVPFFFFQGFVVFSSSFFNRYGNEGFRKAPDNDKVFLAWVEKERQLNLRSNYFIGVLFR
jgi:hypothetical protein